MSLTLWIHSILCHVGLSSNRSSNLYYSLPYSLSYSLHKKFGNCVNKYLLMILTIKVITQKSSQISYKLIYLLSKSGITLSIRHIPKRIREKMRNLSTISLYPTKFDIFFPPLHFAMETLVHMIRIKISCSNGKNQTYQTYHLDLIKVTWLYTQQIILSYLKFNECIQGIRSPMYIFKPKVIITTSNEIPVPSPCMDTKSSIHVSMH